MRFFFVCVCAVPILQADLLARLVTLDNCKLLKQSFIISQREQL